MSHDAAVCTKKDIADLKLFIIDELVGVKKEIAKVDERLSVKLDQVDERLSGRIDQVEAGLAEKIDDLAAAVGEALSRISDLDDERYSNHERRICRLEKRIA